MTTNGLFAQNSATDFVRQICRELAEEKLEWSVATPVREIHFTKSLLDCCVVEHPSGRLVVAVFAAGAGGEDDCGLNSTESLSKPTPSTTLNGQSAAQKCAATHIVSVGTWNVGVFPMDTVFELQLS
jgi:nucleoside-diphosphate-sugar epimerase